MVNTHTQREEPPLNDDDVVRGVIGCYFREIPAQLISIVLAFQ